MGWMQRTVILSLAATLSGCSLAPGTVTSLAPSQASTFARKTDAFSLILQKVKQQGGADSPRRPQVVFDLDDTLFCTAFRSLQILKEWSDTPGGLTYRAKVTRLTKEQVGYSIEPGLTQIGVPQPEWEGIKRFWGDRFFTGEYLRYDRPYPGAVPYARSLHQAGARIVYLTGRWDAMRKGTEDSIRNSGLPWDASGRTTVLVTKPDKALKDVEYKAAKIQELKSQGPIVASVDNEPRNVNMFHEQAPEATVVFIDKPHSPTAPPVNAGIAQVKDFPQ